MICIYIYIVFIFILCAWIWFVMVFINRPSDTTHLPQQTFTDHPNLWIGLGRKYPQALDDCQFCAPTLFISPQKFPIESLFWLFWIRNSNAVSTLFSHCFKHTCTTLFHVLWIIMIHYDYFAMFSICIYPIYNIGNPWKLFPAASRHLGPGFGRMCAFSNEVMGQKTEGGDVAFPDVFFSRMRSEGSRFTWGSGGEAVFAKFCVCDRNRSQPFASVRNRLWYRRKALHSGECVWRGPETVSHWVVSPQLYWCLQRRCLCEWSVSPQLYRCLQRRCLWERSVPPQLYRCLQRRCLCEWSVSPQLYRCLQRRCLWERSVSPQLYWCLQRRCLCEWSVSPQLYRCLQRRCLWERSVPPQLYWCLQRRCLCEWSVSPQLYWCLQRRCLCECSVSPQLYRCLQRRCLWEWSVSPQLYWCLQKRCLCEWSQSPQLYWCLQKWCQCEWSVSSRSVLQECQVRLHCTRVWVPGLLVKSAKASKR